MPTQFVLWMSLTVISMKHVIYENYVTCLTNIVHGGDTVILICEFCGICENNVKYHAHMDEYINSSRKLLGKARASPGCKMSY